ncbi:hypothetical protein HMPREF1141_0578 [Clostridium sp. MSTE9]|nr:hypothetical protein HMPREF1141_0578 [Clostridium sp. MSTE9]
MLFAFFCSSQTRKKTPETPDSLRKNSRHLAGCCPMTLIRL